MDYEYKYIKYKKKYINLKGGGKEYVITEYSDDHGNTVKKFSIVFQKTMENIDILKYYADLSLLNQKNIDISAFINLYNLSGDSYDIINDILYLDSNGLFYKLVGLKLVTRKILHTLRYNIGTLREKLLKSIYDNKLNISKLTRAFLDLNKNYNSNREKYKNFIDKIQMCRTIQHNLCNIIKYLAEYIVEIRQN